MLFTIPNIGYDNPNLLVAFDDVLERLNNSNAIVCYDPTLPRSACEVTSVSPKVDLNTGIPLKVELNIVTLSIIKHQEIMDKWVKLYSLFKESYDKSSNSFEGIPFEKIENDFRYSLDTILQFSPDVISVGSDEDCIFIYAEFENKAMFFNLFFEEDVTEVLLNLTENREPIGSFNSDIKKSLHRLKNYVGEKVYENIYDLSNTPTTTTKI